MDVWIDGWMDRKIHETEKESWGEGEGEQTIHIIDCEFYYV